MGHTRPSAVFLASLAIAAAYGCAVEGGKDVPLVSGEGVIAVDSNQKVTLDTSKVPVLLACAAGLVVRRNAAGTDWECAVASVPGSGQVATLEARLADMSTDLLATKGALSGHAHSFAQITGFAAGTAGVLASQGVLLNTPSFDSGTGRAHLTVSGPSGAGVLELATNQSPEPDARLGVIQFSDAQQQKRLAWIAAVEEGTDPANMGAALWFGTTAPGSNTDAARLIVSGAGKVGIGKTPAEALDVSGNIGVTGTVKGKSLTLSCVNVSSGCTSSPGPFNLTCGTGYTATGCGWEPCANWDTGSCEVINSTQCSCYATVTTNWRCECRCCRIE